MLTLAKVIEVLTGQEIPLGAGQPITDVVIDSRLAIPGCLFVALQGEKSHGHEYVAAAFGQGAAVALVEGDLTVDCQHVDLRDKLDPPPATLELPLCLRVESSLNALQRVATYWRNQHRPRVIGITGSVGKTTTKELVAAVLGRRYNTLRSRGSYNNEIGLPLTLLQLTSAHERVVLEMGMYDVGEISELTQIARPHVGVVTNVGPVHLERAGSMERIAQAKAELVEALPSNGTAILNFDDPLVRDMAQKTEAKVFYYGLSRKADLWASRIQGMGLEGIRFRMHYGRETVHLRVPLLGRHSVHTALRAAAVGLVEGESWQEIVEGLQGGSPQLRLVAVDGINGSTLLDDTYNASPQSTLAALTLLDELDGRKIAVLGDMLELGAYEEEGHRKVGLRVIDSADVLITIGRLGRIIGEAALRWGMESSSVHVLENNAQAIELLTHTVAPGDVILVKGSRAMLMEEIVMALARPVNAGDELG
ncbi:MAG: UDP-N-acetylmuramoyl-tripeptide--D-alanyl-D-alanine ligase [Anaerolineae bacterium]|jgi:UDP-N-acetylmuramoyl-tripeptide--D-alanyl-D-alanine ligase